MSENKKYGRRIGYPFSFQCTDSDCKGRTQGYDRREKVRPNPGEPESQITEKFYEHQGGGIFNCVGATVAGANGGTMCAECTDKYSLKRREMRERREAELR